MKPSLEQLKNLFIDGLEYSRKSSLSSNMQIDTLIRLTHSVKSVVALGCLAQIPRYGKYDAFVELKRETSHIHHCMQFGRDSTGWYRFEGIGEMKGGKKQANFSLIVMRIELAPSCIVKSHRLNPEDAVLWGISGGVGITSIEDDACNAKHKRNGLETWQTIPHTITQGEYKCINNTSFNFKAEVRKMNTEMYINIHSNDKQFNININYKIIRA